MQGWCANGPRKEARTPPIQTPPTEQKPISHQPTRRDEWMGKGRSTAILHAQCCHAACTLRDADDRYSVCGRTTLACTRGIHVPAAHRGEHAPTPPGRVMVTGTHPALTVPYLAPPPLLIVPALAPPPPPALPPVLPAWRYWRPVAAPAAIRQPPPCSLLPSAACVPSHPCKGLNVLLRFLPTPSHCCHTAGHPPHPRPTPARPPAAASSRRHVGAERPARHQKVGCGIGLLRRLLLHQPAAHGGFAQGGKPGERAETVPCTP